MMAVEILLGLPSAGDSGGGGSERCVLIIPETVSAVNGRLPESI